MCKLELDVLLTQHHIPIVHLVITVPQTPIVGCLKAGMGLGDGVWLGRGGRVMADGEGRIEGTHTCE